MTVACEITSAALTAPIDCAAESQPYWITPMCKTSRTKRGISVLAEEKKVAKKSSTMVERMMGWVAMKRTPSLIASKLRAGFVPVGAR